MYSSGMAFALCVESNGASATIVLSSLTGAATS
jgi:hypothetical protein